MAPLWSGRIGSKALSRNGPAVPTVLCLRLDEFVRFRGCFEEPATSRVIFFESRRIPETLELPLFQSDETDATCRESTGGGRSRHRDSRVEKRC